MDSFPYQTQYLTVVVVGASGDLAKKKTYPSLFQLYCQNYFPASTSFNIVGYARSDYTDKTFQEKMREAIVSKGDDAKIDNFLQNCRYQRGEAYSDVNAWTQLHEEQSKIEGSSGVANRLFYFAIPPEQFAPSAQAITEAAQTKSGWNRFIVEKPFGVDLESSNKLAKDLAAVLKEEQIYRIDHYLGKEMVQNLMVLRFANIFLAPLWNRDYIKSVTILFKEDIGCEGRGGYFDPAGIIRDVQQNHLLQILSIIAMEPPKKVTGPGAGEYIRDEKVKLLKCIPPLTVNDVILGQFVSGNGQPGYLDDETCNNEYCPTYALTKFQINNARWAGVPFIMASGKALDERKGEVKIQFKNPPGVKGMFSDGQGNGQRNELVIRIQPGEALTMKLNVKTPGFKSAPIASNMDLLYDNKFPNLSKEIPDAYTRLILDVLRDNSSAFVRDDELEAAWTIFSPLLHALESDSRKRLPIKYPFGSVGPKEAQEFLNTLYNSSENMARL
jgi:glucose-6-phosphate 1-dehydrogenase